MRNPRDVRGRQPLGNALGLEALIHFDERPKVSGAVLPCLECSTLAGSDLGRSEYSFWGARHTHSHCTSKQRGRQTPRHAADRSPHQKTGCRPCRTKTMAFSIATPGHSPHQNMAGENGPGRSTDRVPLTPFHVPHSGLPCGGPTQLEGQVTGCYADRDEGGDA